jgi:hypothetical protein
LQINLQRAAAAQSGNRLGPAPGSSVSSILAMTTDSKGKKGKSEKKRKGSKSDGGGSIMDRLAAAYGSSADNAGK